MRAELRRARYGYLLALHLLLLCAAGRTPSEVAAVLFCSRSSVYRILRAYRAGTLTCDEATEQATQQRRLRLLTPSLKRSVQALLKTAPRASGSRPRFRWHGCFANWPRCSRRCPSCPPRKRILFPESFFPIAVAHTSVGRRPSPLALRPLSWPVVACDSRSFFSIPHYLSYLRLASDCSVQLSTSTSLFMNNPG